MKAARKTVLLRDLSPGESGKTPRLSWMLSGLMLTTLLVTAVSGLFLLSYYHPSLEGAQASISFLRTRVFLGGAVHALHFWGARLLLILLVLHMVEAGFRSDPPGISWGAGLALGGMVLVSYLTGHLLSGTHGEYWAFQVTLERVEKVPGMAWFLHTVLGWEGRVNDVVFGRSLAFHVSAFWAVGGVLAWMHLKGWFSQLSLRGEVVFWRSLVLTLVILAILGTLGVLFPPQVEQPVDFFRPEGQVLLPFAPFVSPLRGALGSVHRLSILLLVVGAFFLPRFSERWRKVLWTGWVLVILVFLILGRGLE